MAVPWNAPGVNKNARGVSLRRPCPAWHIEVDGCVSAVYAASYGDGFEIGERAQFGTGVFFRKSDVRMADITDDLRQRGQGKGATP
jgi:hypothetical protein